MVWCRKVWRDIAAFRCESCPDAVEVNRTILCGRLPGTPPDPKAIAEADEWGKITARPSSGRSTRRNGRTRKTVHLNVTMRDKGEAKAAPATTETVAPTEAAPRPRRARRSPTRPPKAGPVQEEAENGDAPSVPESAPVKKSGRRRGSKGRRRGRSGGRRSSD